nr:MAG TPA: hypothetical protein [Caudoviricetes sp.]
MVVKKERIRRAPICTQANIQLHYNYGKEFSQ